MKRRKLVIASLATFSGCTSTLVNSESKEQGEQHKHKKISVAVTDSKTADTLKIRAAGEVYAIPIPDNAKLALAKLEVENQDITGRKIPTVNVRDYTDMQVDTNEVDPITNDVRIYGSGKGGHLPSDSQGTIEMLGYSDIIVGEKLNAYPNSVTGTRKSAPPNSKISGWIFGTIPNEAKPQVKVKWGGQTSVWKLRE